MNRILLAPDEVDAGGRAVLADARAAHITGVLRAAPGATVRVGQLNGPRGTATVADVAAGQVTLECRFEAAPPPRPRLDLLLALPRPKVMKRLWAPLASLGIGRIILTNAAQVERNYFDTHWLTPAAYRPLLIEGLQQSGDTWLPDVLVVREFRPLVEDRLDELCPGTVRLVGNPAAARSVRQLALRDGQRVLAAVGPEGGWTDFELDLLEAHGCSPVRLNGGTLRSDIACIALLAVVREWMG